MDYKKVWVILPAYNEENLKKFLKETREHIENIIVVDDGSSKELYSHIPIEILITHKKNYGKGAALRTGCDYAFFHKKAEAVILIDSDGQHDPSLIPEFINKLNNYDVVFGSRRFECPMPITTQFGNWAISKIMKILFKTKISDALSGYRAMTRKAYFKIRWLTNRYKVESDIIINIKKKNISYCEIPIPTIYHKERNVNKREGFKILFHVLRRRFFDENTFD